MLTTCKVCGEAKVRIASGRSPNGRRKYYKDENGDSWMGLKCPSCQKKLNRERMALKRKAKDDNENVLVTESNIVNND